MMRHLKILVDELKVVALCSVAIVLILLFK